VTVTTRSQHCDAAGLTGVVVGSYDDAAVLVRIDELDKVFSVPIADLASTGVRRASTRATASASLRVNQSGAVLGRDDYLILEDMDDL
jgi:hypothetical protein